MSFDGSPALMVNPGPLSAVGPVALVLQDSSLPRQITCVPPLPAGSPKCTVAPAFTVIAWTAKFVASIVPVPGGVELLLPTCLPQAPTMSANINGTGMNANASLFMRVQDPFLEASTIYARTRMSARNDAVRMEW